MAFTESIVEDATLHWFGELDYALLHGQEIAPGEAAAERTSFAEAFLPDRLRVALRKLNPKLPADALDDAYRKITIPVGPNLTAQNRAFHRMIADGIAVECRRKDGSIGAEIVRLIDFADADNNDWLVANQFTVIEGQHNRRPDVVVFVNGLPLGVIELKNAADENADIWQAFSQLQTYKQQVPALFVHNAVLIISDGLEARIGTISADKERFMPWRTIEGETVAPSKLPQLEVLLRGVFDKRRFLDLVRHFIVFEDDGGHGVVKKLAGYHQFHAVNIATTMRQSDDRSKDLGLSQDEVAFYDALETNDSAVKALGDKNLKFIAQELVTTIRKNVTIDWTAKESVRAKLRVMVKRVLRKYGYPPDKQAKATQTVLQQAELLCADWAG